MWFYCFFMNKTSSAVLNAQLSADLGTRKHSRSTSNKTRYFAILPQLVHFLLKRYTTSEVIAQTDFRITRFGQLSGMALFQHAEKLVRKTLRFEDVYKSYVLAEASLEELNASISQSKRKYWVGQKKAKRHNLASYTTSVLKLRVNDVRCKRMCPATIKPLNQHEKPKYSHKLSVVVQREYGTTPWPLLEILYVP